MAGTGVKAMGSFSIGEAYGAGFGLVGRKPLHVLTWGIVYSVLRMLPFVLMMATIGPEVLKAYGEFLVNAMSGGDPQAGMEDFMRTMSKVQSFQSLGFLTSILAMAIFNAAVFRAMLRPGDGGFLNLKLGMDEVWQGLLYLCLVILLCIFAVLVALAGVMVGLVFVLIGNAAGSGWITGLGITLDVIACIVVIVWICVRFSLAGPATFATRNFQLFESWNMTKGHSWSLLGLALLLFLTIMAFEIVMGGIILGTFFSLGGTEALSPESIEAFFAQDPSAWMTQAAPWLIGMTIVGALISGAIYTIMLAPFASVYRQLMESQAPAQPAPSPAHPA